MRRSTTNYLVWINTDHAGRIHKCIKGQSSGMYQRFLTILCSLSCIILLMPQGWCCWLAPLSCCQVMAETKLCCQHQAKAVHSCCKQQSTSPESGQPAPLPVKCVKCLNDTIKSSFAHDFDLSVELLGLLPVVSPEVPPVSLFLSPAHLHGDSPPLYVQLCVWRC